MTDIPGLLPTGAVLSALPLSSSPTLAIDCANSIKVRVGTLACVEAAIFYGLREMSGIELLAFCATSVVTP
jgi:hypothetical protein